MTFALVLAFACQGEDESDPVGVSGSGAEAGATGSEADSGDGAVDGGGESGPGGDCGSDPADDVCTACLKMNCCTEWKTCRAEQPCTTCTDCLGEELDLGSCNFSNNTCTFMGTADPTARMLSCGLEPCEIECGFN